MQKITKSKYDQALDKIISVRIQRGKFYGDDYLQDPLEYDIWMLYGKLRRLMRLFKDGNNSYEKLEDTLIDAANYCIFAISKLDERKKISKFGKDRK